MTTDIALFHLHSKIQVDLNSTPEEIDAINHLVQWVNDQKKDNLQHNNLFAKVYAVYFGVLIDHYRDVEFAQKQLHKELSDPFEMHSECIRKKINNLVFDNFLKSININMKDYNFMTDEEIEEREKVIQQHQERFLSSTQKYSQEKINQALENQISEAINRFKQYD